MLNFCFLPQRRGAMSQLNLKPAHAAVKNYYAALHQFGQLHFDNEAQVGDAFAKVLTDCGRKLLMLRLFGMPPDMLDKYREKDERGPTRGRTTRARATRERKKENPSRTEKWVLRQPRGQKC